MRPDQTTRFGLALLLVLSLSGLAASSDSSRYSKDDLLRPGPVRTFEGRTLNEVAFPLGGIGTGTIWLHDPPKSRPMRPPSSSRKWAASASRRCRRAGSRSTRSNAATAAAHAAGGKAVV